jgi:hypothetical protein
MLDFQTNEWGSYVIDFMDILRSFSGKENLNVENVERFMIKTLDVSLDDLSFYAGEPPPVGPVNVMDGEINWIPSFDYLWDGAIDANDIESAFDADQGSNVINLYARGSVREFTFRPDYDTAGVESIKFDAKVSSVVERIEIKINTDDGNWYRLFLAPSYNAWSINGQYVYVPMLDLQIDEWGNYVIDFMDILRSFSGKENLNVEDVDRFMIKTLDVSLDDLYFD